MTKKAIPPTPEDKRPVAARPPDVEELAKLLTTTKPLPTDVQPTRGSD